MSFQAEQSLIASVFLDNAALERLANITAAHFSTPRHRVIWESIASQASRGLTADVVTVFEDLSQRGLTDMVDGLPGLNEIALTVSSIRGVDRYAQIVIEAATSRDLLTACREAVDVAQEEGEIDQKMDRVYTILSGIQGKRVRKESVPIALAAARALERYEELAQGRGERGWSTGIRRLDEFLAGGLRPGRLYGIAARPSVGKSSVARQIALSTAKAGLSTLILSQEMPVDEVTDCLISQLGHINAEKLITGKLEHEDWSRMVEAAEQTRDLPLRIDDDGGLTLQQVAAKCRMVRGLKVVVLDYLQLCGSDLKSSTNDQIAEISKGLKRLALQQGLAVVVLSQLNRDVEKRQDKEPQLSDLRDSGAIEQDLDVAVLLWTAKEDQDSRLVGVKVAKNRSGGRGVFALRFRPATYSWFPSDEPLKNNVVELKQGGGFR